MPASILVATPHAAFGELLRVSLEENEYHQVRLVMSAKETRAAFQHGTYQMAIIDASLADEPLIPLCVDLLERQKGVRLVIIPPDNNPNHPALGGLMPHGYLSRPFYLPDLMEMVDRLLNERSTEMKAPENLSDTLPPWLQEPLTLQAYLERELAATQALAGIVGVVRPQAGSSSQPVRVSGSILASTGVLDTAAAGELAAVVFRYWNRDEKTDLMRFIRLSSDKRDYLVYVTEITGDLVLILVNDTTSPLSQIRPQTKAMAQALATRPPPGYEEKTGSSGPAGSQPSASPSQPGAKFFTVHDWALDEPPVPAPSAPAEPPQPSTVGTASVDSAAGDTAAGVSAASDVKTQPLNEADTAEDTGAFLERLRGALPSIRQGSDETGKTEEGGDSVDLSALLGAVPPPDPGEENQNGSGKSPEPNNSAAANPTYRFSDWRVAGEDLLDVDLEEPTISLPPRPGPASPPGPAGSETPDRALDAPQQRDLDDPDDAGAQVMSALTHLGQLEPVSPAVSLLNYTCVLVPRLPQHYLTGSLADQLGQWVQQLCLAYGWRLEGISIRPEYLQWNVQVTPSVSPGNLVRIIRQRTSQQIFSAFEHLAHQNPSGDFWAVGYLIVSGAQPPSAQLLRDFIAQTRKRQGIGR